MVRAASASESGWARRLGESMVSIADVEGDDHEHARSKRLLVGVLWVSLPVSIASAFQMAFVLDAPPAALVIGSGPVTAAGSLVALWLRPTVFPGIMHLLVGVVVAISAALTVMAGGLLDSGFNAVWGFLGLLGAVALFGDRRATWWLWVFIASQIAALVAAAEVAPIYEMPSPEYTGTFNLVVVVIFVFHLMLYYVRQRDVLLQRSDRLLRNTLPDSVAERLKANPDERIADRFDSASVLFADVVGFTPMSAGMTPDELVAFLDEVFSDFDKLVEARGLEKIKTVGDEYMVAAGVPASRPDHAHVLCDLALTIRDRMRSREYRGHRIELRMGINSGPVVAGIIGTRKFSYDLWGDAVNTASRMESSGVPGEIQITEETRRLVEDEYVCTFRDTIDIKGKGPTPVWQLAGRRTRPGA
ncbi:MAG TPA: adenylate/guanylate cyclase domain-containing protein [Acidimicrobiia bacterium]|nr:adenylate/guanylate cyclase domain-containing protein [Acidimicrobiia bacterium]